MTIQRNWCVIALTMLVSLPALAQKTSSFTANIAFTPNGSGGPLAYSVLNSTGAVTPIGLANFRFQLAQAVNNSNGQGVGPAQVTMTMAFNRQDVLNGVSTTPLPDLSVQSPATIDIAIGGSTGVNAGATGTLSATFTRLSGGSSTATASVTVSGLVTVGGKATAISIPSQQLGSPGYLVQEINSVSGSGSMPPFGNVTLDLTSLVLNNSSVHESNFTFKFNSTDSLNAFQTYGASFPANAPFTITGGTGAFAGATGSGTINLLPGPAGSPQGTGTAVVTGTVTQPAAGRPVITRVTTGSGNAAIGQNTWIEIFGNHLTPATTPAGGFFWSDAPEFKSGRMPTTSGGMSVTVNGKSAYVWWFCSAATTPACATDQINVLTPLDSSTGLAQVVVTNGTVSSAPFVVSMQSPSPSMLLVSPKGYILATHGDGTLVGPTTLFPGNSTPAKRGEQIVLWGVGFGLPDGPIVEGSSTQSAPMPFFPSCFMGSSVPNVAANLVSPGLYQFNVTVPSQAPTGDVPMFCIYSNKSFTPAGNLITIQ
jgi:uncharacterized protein (TIGR03437 family)